MEIIERDNDREVCFTEDQVSEAKAYYIVSGDDEQIKAYNAELSECETLSQIADVYNKYTGLLFDGSELKVREI